MHNQTGTPPTLARTLLVLTLGCLALAPALGDEPAAAGPAPPATTSPAPVLPEAQPATDGARDAAQARFLRLLDEGRNEEAVAAAREVVELTRQAVGDTSSELALPLSNLATAQFRAGDLLAAESNYKAAILLLEKRYGIVSERIINPLTGLGDVYVRGEQYAQATEAYSRALRINHVNDGFYNFDQFRIRDGLTEGYLGQRDIEKANFNQETQVAIQRRRLGRGNPELAPALDKLGRWYERTNQPEAARYVYQDAARLVEQAEGPTSPDLVDPLIAMAKSYRQQALLPPDPEATQGPQTLLPMSSAMLRRALVIIDKQQPPDPRKRAEVLVALGDLYQLWGKVNSANDRYSEAWQELAGDEFAEARDGYFANPARLYGPDLPRVYPPPQPDQPPPKLRSLEPGYVVVRYSVSAAGQVTEASVVEADPAGLLEKSVTDSLRRTLFRPRYAEGVAVDAPALTLRHEFRFAPPSRDRAPAAEDGDNQPLPPPEKAPPAPDKPPAPTPAGGPLSQPANTD
jgi:TonB family protein